MEDRHMTDAERTLVRHGFRRCDIPACNCGGWHHVDGLAARWRELEEVLEPRNGETLRGAAEALRRERDVLREALIGISQGVSWASKNLAVQALKHADKAREG